MSETLQIQATTRKTDGKVVRDEQTIPAVVYGKNQEAISLSIPRGDFLKVYNQASSSTIIELIVDGEKDSHDVLIHDVQVDSARNEIIHLDFYATTKGQALQTEVPLQLTGEAPGAREGLLVTVRDNIEISAKPKDLPEHIEVDVTKLEKVGDNVTIGELKLPAGVSLVNNDEEFLGEPVVKIDAKRVEEAEEVKTEEVAAEPEAAKTEEA